MIAIDLCKYISFSTNVRAFFHSDTRYTCPRKLLRSGLAVSSCCAAKWPIALLVGIHFRSAENAALINEWFGCLKMCGKAPHHQLRRHKVLLVWKCALQLWPFHQTARNMLSKSFKPCDKMTFDTGFYITVTAIPKRHYWQDTGKQAHI